ncbi:glycoside hydrolase family 3 protein [Xylariaceae sp. FL0594]|nr:glycoside hydrolase family 3 protein [Xylariaceae sp. FL0594]
MVHLRYLLASAGFCGSALAISTAEAAAHVIFSYTGTNHPASLTTLAGKCELGGVIIFKDNVDSKLSAYLSNLQSVYASAGCAISGPLLILTDQEGGEVLRLPGGPTLSEKDIGALRDPSVGATTAGVQAAAALKAYSHNGNLAPVLDVYHKAGDFEDQYERSYSNNATVVAQAAVAFIKAQQARGVVATAKHFPGLGAAEASQNTDAQPVTINRSLDQLRAIDEVPYVEVIKAGVGMIMASWALYPALDATYPSGISKKWITGELRGRLGWNGVVVTDAIEAGGLNNFGADAGKRAVMAIAAGQDLILAAGRTVSQGQAITSALVSAVADGTLTSSFFSTSTQRLQKLRSTL